MTQCTHTWELLRTEISDELLFSKEFTGYRLGWKCRRCGAVKSVWRRVSEAEMRKLVSHE